MVANDSGQSALSAQTAEDPLVDDGFYTVFSPSGSHMYSATNKLYGPVSVGLVVPNGGTLKHDFDLPAGMLTASPELIELNVVSGMTATVPYLLSNDGTQALDFKMTELAPSPNPLVNRYASRHIRKNPAGSLGSQFIPSKAASPEINGKVAGPLAAGDVLDSWPSGLTFNWSAAFDALDGTVWVNSPCTGWGGDCKAVEYQPDGSPTGREYAYDWNPGFGPADMTYNARTGMIWVMDVGTDNCIHELDPDSGFTGSMICDPVLPGWGGTSMRGLAYDPNTDTFYTGRYNYSGCPVGVCDVIFHFKGASWDTPGEVIDTHALPGIEISGLAYNPLADSLFVASSPTDSVNEYTVSTWALANSFTVTGLNGQGADIDCEGNLWMSTADSNDILLVDTARPGSLCPGVDWMSASPVTGTLSTGGSQPGLLTLDAGAPSVTGPGTYAGILRIKSFTPYGAVNIPVTMTVSENGIALTPPADAMAGDPGTVVTYMLNLENTGLVTDTFDLTSSGNAWDVLLPVTQIELASGANADFSVEVSVPANAMAGEMDSVMVTATSQASPGISASSELTTSANAVYGLTLAPATAAMTGHPGETVTYTLHLTNTGNITDTFDLAASGNTWNVQLPVGPIVVAGGASQDLAVIVIIPAGAGQGDEDMATITATSQGDNTKSASSDLTTTARLWEVYLPLIFKVSG